MKKYTSCLLLVSGICTLHTGAAIAQPAHFNLFDASPLTNNPALTGMFDGDIRANANYRNQWTSVTVPYISGQASVDAPVYTMRSGDFFGGGLQLSNSNSGDGNLRNFAGLVSGSFHKHLGNDSAVLKGRGYEIAIGVQAGYAQSSIDLSRLYFADTNTTPITGTVYSPGISSMVSSYVINAGITLSRSVSHRFSYMAGFSVSNINQPNDALLLHQTAESGLDIKYTSIAGCNIQTGKRLTLRPALILVSQSGRNNFIIGNEFSYNAGSTVMHTDLFAGLWYRTQDVVMVTAGIRLRKFRIGVAYDYNTSQLNTATNGSGGFELALGYTGGGSRNTRRQIPCTRF